MTLTPVSERPRRQDFQWQIPDRFNFATDVVDAWAEQDDRLALIWEDEAGATARFRYSDISRESRKLARVLLDAGINKGDRIIILLPRIPEWQIAMVAALRIGAIPIPCIEMLTERDIAYRINHSGARGIICRDEKAALLGEASDGLVCRVALGGTAGWIDMQSATDAAPADAPAAVMGAEDPAIMYYTSGSTGHPKGVLHAARGLYSWRMSARYWLDLTPEDRIWCTADTGWSKAGTSILFGPWSEGACSFFFHGGFDPAKRLELLAKHEISIYCAPATELNRVVNEDVTAYDLTALRRTVSSGEAMNVAVARRWEDATGAMVAEAYGQTETLMTVLNHADAPLKQGSMGQPAPGCDVDIIDDGGRRLADGEEGHVAVQMPNPQMMIGYWKDPGTTAASHVTGPDGTWFVTGDVGIRDEDGYIWYQGRSDDVISSAGYRIGPLEVENALLEHEAVLECAVIGAPDPERGEVVRAEIVLKDGVPADETLKKALQDHVKSVTAPYKYPRQIAFRGDLPKTPTGKIKRRSLRDDLTDQKGEARP